MIGAFTLPWAAAGALIPTWVEMHAAVTHFPIVLLIAALFSDVAGLALRKPACRTAALWLLGGAVLTGVPALATGWATAAGGIGGGAALSAHRLAAFASIGAGAGVLAWRLIGRGRVTPRAGFCATCLLAASAVLVGLTGHLGGMMVFGANPGSAPWSSSGPRAASDHHRLAKVTLGDVARGSALFAQLGCGSCHTMADGRASGAAPNLAYEGKRHPEVAWQIDHLMQPGKLSPGSPMPSYRRLPPQDLEAIASYLVTRQ